ncbi:MAG TPA: methyltransferase [Mycobacteriales bacterium]|nr:methyltransferase [Mycobacteriales bacterium]
MDAPPPPIQMVQLLAGFQVSQALYAAAKLGIPDLLADGPQTAAQVAHARQLNEASTARLMRSLTGFGVLASDGDGYRLTPLGDTLRSDAPGSMRNLALMWMETHYLPFAGLTDTVRTGNVAATEHYGMPFFAWLSGDHDRVAQFSGAMANLTDGIKAHAIAGYDFGAPSLITDLGGADGTLLAMILGRLPDTAGVVLDLPHVVSAVPTVAKEHGLDDRLTGQPGDFFEAVPPSEVYVMSMVLHDWSDAEALTLLRNIASAAEPGAQIRAFELVVPPGDAPHMSKMVDLTMLAITTGRERDETELRELFTAAGLVFDGIVATPTPLSVVEAHVA